MDVVILVVSVGFELCKSEFESVQLVVRVQFIKVCSGVGGTGINRLRAAGSDCAECFLVCCGFTVLGEIDSLGIVLARKILVALHKAVGGDAVTRHHCVLFFLVGGEFSVSLLRYKVLILWVLILSDNICGS